MRILHAAVELVELHQYAGVGGVEGEGALHILHGLFLLVAFVEQGEGQVPPHGGELGIEFGRGFPVVDGQVVLPFVIVEAAQVIVGLGSVGIHEDGVLQREDGFQSVGEAVAAVGLLGLLEEGIGLYRVGQSAGIAHIVIGHRTGGFLVDGDAPDVDGGVGHAGLHVVEGQFVVVVVALAQHRSHLGELLPVASEQVLLVAATVVEAVETQALVDEGGPLFGGSMEQAQDGGLQRTGLVVVPVVVQTAVDFVEGILVTALRHGDFGGLEVAGIGPCLVPCGFPESFVGLVGLALVFQGEGEVVDGFAVIGVGVALH